MKLSWKLLPVATLFALGVFMVSLPSGAKPASALVTSLNLSLSSQVVGGQVTVTGTYTDDSNSSTGVTLTTSNPAVALFSTASIISSPVTANPETVTTTTSVVSVTEDTPDVIQQVKTLTATVTCVTAGTVQFTMTQSATPSSTLSAPAVLTCGTGTGGAGTGQLTIQTYSTVLAQGAQGSYTAYATTSVVGQYITITSTPALLTFQNPNVTLNGLTGISEQFYGQNTTSVTDVTSTAGNREITGTFICTSQGTATLTITLGQGQAVGAVGGQTSYSQPIICGTGLVSPTVGPASAVTVAASPTSVGCAGTAFVTVTVRNALGGYVADGTSVTLSSTVGTLSPTTATTLGGGVLAVFTAPSNQSGTASISANAAGTAQGTASIAVSCNAATPTPAIPPTIYVPPVITGGGNSGGTSIGTGIISPPNTGDAGMATDNTWQLYAGIALMVMSAAGAAVVVRVRADS